MSNPAHIDLLLNHTTGNITTDPQNIVGGSNGLFLKAVFDGATIKLQLRPKGGTGWYDKTEGTFTVVGLTETLFWINADLSEGDVRAVVSGATVNTDVTEFLLRPVSEYEYDLG